MFRSALQPWIHLLVLLLILVAACSDDENEERSPPEYTPVRAYAGMQLASAPYEGLGDVIEVEFIDEEGPAASAGVAEGDLILAVDGEDLDSPADIHRLIDSASPGDLLELTVGRLPASFRGDEPPEPDEIDLTLTLAEEPLPHVFSLWRPHTDLEEHFQLRLGVFLSDITKPLADFYALGSPEGVLVRGLLPLHAALEEGLREGDVLVAIMGEEVDYLHEVQSVLEDVDEDEPVEATFERGGREMTVSLGVLGPNLPGANALPIAARRRLQDAISNGGPHPDHVPLVANTFHLEDPASGGPARRNGVIQALSDTSITIEIYSTGSEWTLNIGPEAALPGADRRDPGASLDVGDFVEMYTRDGQTALFIVSRAEPLR